MSRSRPTRLFAGGALAGVSGIAAVVSYLHALQVVRSVGATPPVSWLIPFLADLVILGASASWLESSRAGRRVPVLTVVSLAAGVGVTLAMNVAAGWHHGTGGRLVAGWPAVAFILALESLAGIVRRGRDGAGEGTVPAAYPADGGGAVDVAGMLQRLVDHFGSQRAVERELKIPRDHLRKLIAPPAEMAALNGDGQRA